MSGWAPLWNDRSNDASAGPSTCRPSLPTSRNNLSSATMPSNCLAYENCFHFKSRYNALADLLVADVSVCVPRIHPMPRNMHRDTASLDLKLNRA